MLIPCLSFCKVWWGGNTAEPQKSYLSSFTSIYSTNKRLFRSAETKRQHHSQQPELVLRQTMGCCSHVLPPAWTAASGNTGTHQVVLFPQHLLSFYPPAAPCSLNQRSCGCIQQSLQASSFINCLLNQYKRSKPTGH